MDSVEITAMSAAGNDFILISGTTADRLGEGLADWTRRVCRRAISIGADGLIVVRPKDRHSVTVDFLNPDGSRAFCGNGSRCAARFAVRSGFTEPSLTLHTEIGLVPAVVDQGEVRLTLPPAVDHGERTVQCDGHEHRGRFVTAGIPHFVCEVPDPAAIPLERCAPKIRYDAGFGAAGTNVNFVRRQEDQIETRTYERGVEAETLSCGSGAVAVAFALNSPLPTAGVRVMPASGIAVRVGAETAGDRLWLAGEARLLFDAVVSAEAAAWGD